MTDDPKDSRYPISEDLFRLSRASAHIQEADPTGISYNHAIFCQTSIPYRNPGDGVTLWERHNGKASLLLQAGTVPNPETKRTELVGLPYGAKARLLMIYVNTQAVLTQDPIIDVDKSLTSFVKRLRLDTGGRTITTVKEQLKRLAATNFALNYYESEEQAFQQKANLIQSFDIWLHKDARQRVLWPNTITLGTDYFEHLAQHAVPLDERAIAALAGKAMALDVYAWLAHRLHRVSRQRPYPIYWTVLQKQFGHEYSGSQALKKFRQNFKKCLTIVKAVYPDARFEVSRKGLLLYNSKPPVSYFRGKSIYIAKS